MDCFGGSNRTRHLVLSIMSDTYKIVGIVILIAAIVTLFYFFSSGFTIADIGAPVCEVVKECNGDCRAFCSAYDSCTPTLVNDVEVACLPADAQPTSSEPFSSSSQASQDGGLLQ